MDQYEIRKYGGWHHHMLMTMLAHFFSVALAAEVGGKKPRR
jgi:SRSO17 transposase